MQKAFPIFWFLPKIKKHSQTEPKVKVMIALKNNIYETGWTKPLEKYIQLYFESNLFLRGIPLKNIEDVANLSNKSESFSLWFNKLIIY